MTSEELQAIQKEIKFDCPSMSAVLGVLYNTYKNYYYGVNEIPEQVARKVLEIRDINLAFSAGMAARIDERIEKLHPRGFMSEMDREWI